MREGPTLHLKQIEPRPSILVDTTAWAAALAEAWSTEVAIWPDIPRAVWPRAESESEPDCESEAERTVGTAVGAVWNSVLLQAAATARPITMELLSLLESDEERREVRGLLQGLPLVRVTEEAWETAASLAWEVRCAGYLVPSMRVLVAALALTYGLRLLHADPRLVAVCELAGLESRRVGLIGDIAAGRK